MSEHQHNNTTTVNHEPSSQVKTIWKVFFILSAVTGLEFIIAFVLQPSYFKTSIFVGLTIVKAAYIVGEFMHLKHEAKSLFWAILLPIIFVVWLLLALMLEGGHIFTDRL
jgi:cytochrome c oxidase subunit IV